MIDLVWGERGARGGETPLPPPRAPRHQLRLGLIAQAAVRPLLAVIISLCLDALPGLQQIQEPELIQTLVPKLTVKAFDGAIVGRFPGANQLQRHPALMRPLVHHLKDEFATMRKACASKPRPHMLPPHISAPRPPGRSPR